MWSMNLLAEVGSLHLEHAHGAHARDGRRAGGRPEAGPPRPRRRRLAHPGLLLRLPPHARARVRALRLGLRLQPRPGPGPPRARTGASAMQARAAFPSAARGSRRARWSRTRPSTAASSASSPRCSRRACGRRSRTSTARSGARAAARVAGGNFNDVWLGRWVDGRKVALKQLRMVQSDEKAVFVSGTRSLSEGVMGWTHSWLFSVEIRAAAQDLVRARARAHPALLRPLPRPVRPEHCDRERVAGEQGCAPLPREAPGREQAQNGALTFVLPLLL
jgi:hypothetical protein